MNLNLIKAASSDKRALAPCTSGYSSSEGALTYYLLKDSYLNRIHVTQNISDNFGSWVQWGALWKAKLSPKCNLGSLCDCTQVKL